MAAAAVVGLVACGAGARPDAAVPASAVAEAPIPSLTDGSPTTVDAVVIARFPHDVEAFTEGLVIDDGRFYESIGRLGKSEIRRVDPATGAIEQRTMLPADEFGEGVTKIGDRLIQLTWKSGIGHVYDAASLLPIGTFDYEGEGWGIAATPTTLYVSDGTARIRLFDPSTFAEIGTVEVVGPDGPIEMINELEFVGDELWANLWKSELIVRIEPATGEVLGWVDVGSLRPDETIDQREAVANGIAYDAVADRLFVTGKLWPVVYEIEVPPKAD